MVLTEHVVMLQAMRVTYASFWKVYTTHNEPDVGAMIEGDVDAMYEAYINGDIGGFIPDCQVAHLSIVEGELLC